MTRQLLAICLDGNDPLFLARFWAGVLGWELADDPQDGVALLPNDGTGSSMCGTCDNGVAGAKAARPLLRAACILGVAGFGQHWLSEAR
jgi:hypothetical protein